VKFCRKYCHIRRTFL